MSNFEGLFEASGILLVLPAKPVHKLHAEVLHQYVHQTSARQIMHKESLRLTC